jgi:hypothetical protein
MAMTKQTRIEKLYGAVYSNQRNIKFYEQIQQSPDQGPSSMEHQREFWFMVAVLKQ